MSFRKEAQQKYKAAEKYCGNIKNLNKTSLFLLLLGLLFFLFFDLSMAIQFPVVLSAHTFLFHTSNMQKS